MNDAKRILNLRIARWGVEWARSTDIRRDTELLAQLRSIASTDLSPDDYTSTLNTRRNEAQRKLYNGIEITHEEVY
jgi:hypothetical protein